MKIKEGFSFIFIGIGFFFAWIPVTIVLASMKKGDENEYLKTSPLQAVQLDGVPMHWEHDPAAPTRLGKHAQVRSAHPRPFRVCGTAFSI